MRPTRSTRSTATTAGPEPRSDGFTAEERAAMRERAREARSAQRTRSGSAPKTDPEAEVLAKIAEMPDADRVIVERLHALIHQVAPELAPKTWYGMPAYARDGKVVVFFQPAAKFKARYATLGFSEDARLDDGTVWPTAFALTTLGDAEEAQVRELVARAAG